MDRTGWGRGLAAAEEQPQPKRLSEAVFEGSTRTEASFVRYVGRKPFSLWCALMVAGTT